MLITNNIPDIISPSTVMNTNITSGVIQLWHVVNFGIQIVFTGTPTGTFKLQASCDAAKQRVVTGLYTGSNAPTHWTDVKDSSFVVSAAGDVEWNYSNPGFNWVRVVYTDSSAGSSTAIITSAVYNGKGI